jgi:hypothetical protein
MRLFEFEDRAVAVEDPNTGFVYDAGGWREASISTVRSAIMAGTELSADEFAMTYPKAAKSLPSGRGYPGVTN